eukprot:2787504-Alexandrium_andersonii.AAC.1
MPKHFEKKKWTYGIGFGSITFLDAEAASEAFDLIGSRYLWGTEIKAVSFRSSALKNQDVKKRRDTGVGQNG